MNKKHNILYKHMVAFVNNLKEENLSIYASGAAFFMFLSMVPIFVVICALLPYTPITEEKLIFIMNDILPVRIETIIIGIVDDVYERSAGGVLSVAILVTLWSAGKGILAVVRGLNAINEVEEHRNYFIVRLISSFYTLIMLLCIIFSMILLVFGNVLVQTIILNFPQLESLFTFLLNLRFIFTWLVLTMVFSAFYAYLPNIKLKLSKQLAGASLAAASWNIFSWAFSIYVNTGNSFHLYGNLSIIIITMIWMYICMYILFMGAYWNKMLIRKEENR